jgi:hypothetical protein
MNKPLMTPDPNASACYLNGHLFVLSVDGSRQCQTCGLYYGPDQKMVNALLRHQAGGKEYARQAKLLGMVETTGLPTPALEPRRFKELPPVYKGADGSLGFPSFPVLISLAALFGTLSGLIIWRVITGVLL